MRIHVLQHVSFETEAHIGVWAERNHHGVSRTRLYAGEELPGVEDFDFLVLMGGPMSVHDESEYPFLVAEKRLLKAVLGMDKPILGVCLGAQLVAEALGAAVTKNPEKEIGWFPIGLTDEGIVSDLVGDFPPVLDTFHWHGETFEIPKGAVRLVESEACPNQAFAWGSSVVGLQFHLEVNRAAVAAMVEHGGTELAAGGAYVQNQASMLAGADRYAAENIACLEAMLDRLVEAAG